jgi:DNA polymerase-3 subunit epsilon/CBS domain-containing protein
MQAVSNATPLTAVDIVVIDSETTGLDPRKARIVELAAVRLVAGQLLRETALRRLVRPDEPVPAAATAVHGIDAAKLADAPRFAEVWPEFAASIGDAVVVGHTVGFDLAVLKRECERAGLHWTQPRSLDTRLLAEAAEPNLAGYTLEQLAAWLGVDVVDRHSALGDALTTGAIFCALLPKLRDRGVRTLGEALSASRTLSEAQSGKLGGVPAGPTTISEGPGSDQPLTRIDTYPYRHRVRDVMRAPARVVSAETRVGSALDILMRERISSVFVAANGQTEPAQPSVMGILTERDVLRALAERGAPALELPASQISSRPLAAVPAGAFVYRAIGRMSRLKVRHLGVTDDAGIVCGALSARDLLRLRAHDAVSLGDAIDEAKDVPDLGRAWAKLPAVAAGLLSEGLAGIDVAAVISQELGALTRAAAVVAERRMADAGEGGPPCHYALVVLGSAGRGESLLAMDQDNALIFADGVPDGPEDRWFARLGAHVDAILDEVGVPTCKGGVMARNAQWRGSVATWTDRIRHWTSRSSAQDLLSVDIFFDLRPVHGDVGMAEAVWRSGFDMAKGNVQFAKLLAEAVGQGPRGLSWFGGLRTENGRIDLKRTGLFEVVATARAPAICRHVVARSTPARLEGLRELVPGAAADLDALAEAQRVFLDLILAQQIRDIAAGTPASNKVAVAGLSAKDRTQLRTALGAMRHLDVLRRDLLFA